MQERQNESLFESERLEFKNYTQENFTKFKALMGDSELREFTSGVLTTEQSQNLFDDILSGQQKAPKSRG